MEWMELIPAPARLALSVGGAVLASQANLLPASFQLTALGAGMILCAYGIAASMGPLLKKRRDPDWLEVELRRDFDRQQERLMVKFRNVKSGA
jgi:hypothetical protein